MKWEHRHFYGKAHEHAGKDPDLGVFGNSGTVFDKVRNRKALSASFEKHREEGNEHERRAKHGVQKELQRGVLTMLATPDTNHEIHR